MAPGQHQGLFPNLQIEWLSAKNPCGLMLQKKFVDGPSLTSRPLPSKYAQFKSIAEFSLSEDC
jgi:hypothetical protein